MLTKLIEVIISHCIQVLGYVAQLKLTQCYKSTSKTTQ